MQTRKVLLVSLVAANLALVSWLWAAPPQNPVSTRKTRVPSQPVPPATTHNSKSIPLATPVAAAANTTDSDGESGKVVPAGGSSVALPRTKTAVMARAATGLNVVSAAPALSIETVGPKEINVGKVAPFSITVHNGGESTAHGIIVRTTLPRDAELLRAIPEPNGTGGELQFEIGQLPGKSDHKLRLEIVPHRPGPIDLETTMSFSVSTQTSLVVRQPQLAITCTAPEETLFGELVNLKLKVTNTGDGTAEEVAVTQVRETDQEDAVIAGLPAKIGVLAAGESHEVELRVPANTAGALRAVLVASAAGDLEAKATAEVQVRRPMLEIKTEGPAFRYAHRPGNYAIHLSNPGDAPAKNVSVVAQIPGGLQVTAIEKRAVFSKEKGTISWDLAQVDAGAEVILQYRTKGIAEGEQFQQIVATADAGLKAEATHVTRVESIADVVMTVADTPGPIEVGGTVEYEIRLKNRGTKSAQNVRLTAEVPAALEVSTPEDSTEFVVRGRTVEFNSIGDLPTNEEKILRFRAVGREAGDHSVRVTLQTDSLAREVTAEESTLFYSGDMPGESGGK
ncbi:MAG: DUF11 domain-containing protein [Planctomycetes bacterium]|nr:DUF11 domain-containing protein [Planctomycetota bacterium]